MNLRVVTSAICIDFQRAAFFIAKRARIKRLILAALLALATVSPVLAQHRYSCTTDMQCELEDRAVQLARAGKDGDQ